MANLGETQAEREGWGKHRAAAQGAAEAMASRAQSDCRTIAMIWRPRDDEQR